LLVGLFGVLVVGCGEDESVESRSQAPVSAEKQRIPPSDAGKGIPSKDRHAKLRHSGRDERRSGSTTGSGKPGRSLKQEGRDVRQPNDSGRRSRQRGPTQTEAAQDAAPTGSASPVDAPSATSQQDFIEGQEKADSPGVVDGEGGPTPEEITAIEEAQKRK
jgi:hypothetical protein